MRIGIFGNTGLKNWHYGSVLTCYQLEQVLGKYHDIEFFAKNDDEYAYSRIPDVDAVIINGEGSFHDCRLTSMVMYHILYRAKFHGKKCYLVNATIERIPNYYFLEDFDFIYVREPMSYKYVSTMTDKVKIVPDICFVYKPDLYRSQREGVLVLDHVDEFRSGELKQLADSKMFNYMPMVREGADLQGVNDFLQFMNRYEYIISGRYHGCVFAMMLGLPFSGLISNTWKIESLMDMVGRAGKATTRVNKLCHGMDAGAVDYGIDGRVILEEYKALCEL